MHKRQISLYTNFFVEQKFWIANNQTITRGILRKRKKKKKRNTSLSHKHYRLLLKCVNTYFKHRTISIGGVETCLSTWSRKNSSETITSILDVKKRWLLFERRATGRIWDEIQTGFHDHRPRFSRRPRYLRDSTVFLIAGKVNRSVSSRANSLNQNLKDCNFSFQLSSSFQEFDL